MPETVTLEVLAERIGNLKEAVEKIDKRLEDLQHTFVPRTEFDQLSVIVKGVGNEGGLVKRINVVEKELGDRVDVLEKTAERRKGSWSTMQVIFTVVTTLLGIIVTYLATK